MLCGRFAASSAYPFRRWAKVAAGKNPTITPLPENHRGDTRYVRQMREDETAVERASRVQAFIAANAPREWPTITLKPTAEELHPLVRRTARYISAQPVPPRGLLESRSFEVLDVKVSAGERDRALSILDAIVRALVATGATILPADDSSRPRLRLLGKEVDVRLEEELARSQRRATPAEKARQGRESWYKPDLAVYTPTSTLRLFLLSRDYHNPLLTARFPASALAR